MGSRRFHKLEPIKILYEPEPKMTARQRLMAAQTLMKAANRELNEAARVVRNDDAECLAVCVKALRSVANSSAADGRSRGLARGALRRIGLAP